MTPAPAYLPPGYRLEGLLGSGQTSHVYLARHERYGPLALKLPRQELKDDPVLRRMFENEVQLTLALAHPHVIAAYEGFSTGERAYLALEYCPGGTLAASLRKRGVLPLEEAYRLIVELGSGLEHCHRRRVLHRDLKPANIFLTGKGSKLADFGTGLYVGTVTEERVGTAFYMAPEIFRGEGATTRSDIYSFGIVAYELIAGERPFKGDSYEALLVAHLLSLPKPLAYLRPGVAREVAMVVAAAMSREPARRYATMTAFNEHFARAAGLEPKSTLPDRVVGRAGRASSRASRPAPEAQEKRFLARWFGRKGRA